MPTWLPWPDSSCDGLRATQAGEVLRLTLVAPGTRNAQTPALWRRLTEVGTCLPPEIRVVLIDAEGPSFSAGLDRRMFTPEGIPGERTFLDLASAPTEAADGWISEFQSAFTWQRECPAVTIAAVQGHAIGAGFQLALACDLILAADDAKFSMREVQLGLIPDLGGSQRLNNLIGVQRSLWACATGAPIDGATAAQWGLVTACVPAHDLATSAQKLVDDLLSAPRNSLSAVKGLINGAGGHTKDEQLRLERMLQIGLLRELAAALKPAFDNPTGAA